MSALKPTEAVLREPLQHDYSFLGLGEQDRIEDDYLVQRPVSGGGEMMFGGGRMVAAGAAVGVSDDSYVDGRVAAYLRRMLPRLLSVRDIPGIRGEGGDKKERLTLTDTWAEVERESAEKDMVPLAEWTGIMGYSRDEHPWIGGVPEKEGVWVCGAYTGHGRFELDTDPEYSNLSADLSVQVCRTRVCQQLTLLG